MPDLTFTGIGSGLKVSEIVDALVNAEKTPFVARSNKQEAKITTDISAIGSLKGALEKVTESIKDLGDADNFQLRNTSGGDSFIALTSSKDAQLGNYSVKVDALAKAHKLSSSAFTSSETVGEGSLAISSGTNNFTIAVGATDKLTDVRDAINDSSDNDSITATIVTDDNGQHLVLASKETGVANAITITATDTGDGNNTDNLGVSRLAGTNLTQVDAAADAKITIDGTLVVTNSSNEFKNVIDGVDITARKVHAVDDDISQISFTENNSNIQAGLEKFVESYNELQKLSKSLGRSGQGGSGPLAGDSLLRGVMGRLRQELSNNFDSGNNSTLSLSELGVQSDRYGVLTLDKDVLQKAIDSNVDGVQQFFVGTSSKDGFAASLNKLTDFYTDTDGVIQNRIDSGNKQLDRLDESKLAFGRKMESLEARLLAKFNAMDLIVSNLKSTSTAVQAQLDNMPGVVKKNN